MSRNLALGTAAAIVSAMTSCAGPGPSTQPASCPAVVATPALGLAEKGLENPPLLTIAAAGCRIEVGAYSYSWGSAAGSARMTDIPTVGAAESITLLAPVSHARFTVTSHKLNSFTQCPGPGYDARVKTNADGSATVTPVGPGGIQRVVASLTTDKGTADYVFDWRTKSDGTVAKAGASLIVTSGPSGNVSPSGHTQIHDLIDRTLPIIEVVDITSADGQAVHVRPQALPSVMDCLDDTPIMLFDRNAARFDHPGAAPYRFDVTISVGGVTHRATTTWSGSGDVTADSHDAIELDFVLPLD